MTFVRILIAVEEDDPEMRREEPPDSGLQD